MRHHLQLLRLMFAALALFSFAAVAAAQEITGSIAGTVKDANGAVVKDATVTITDSDKKVIVRTVTTNDDGAFSVPVLQVSYYDVKVEAPGFKTYIETRVKLDVDQRRSVDVTLEAGNISEVVTVEAQTLQVDTQTSTAGTLINGTQVREISLNNRNWVQLLTLAPGVSNDLADQVYVGTTNPSGQANIVNVSVNGARSSSNTYLVDGADVTDRGSNLTIQSYPSVDSIGEFKVLRGLYPAESGSSGGGQINVVTRSGTDKFHGSLFEFVRNDILNANDFLTNSTTSPACGRETNGKARRCPFRYNNYGFTIGGPIILPRFGEGGKAVKRLARTFFFFSEEQRKDRRSTTFTPTVPDANLKQGIFPIAVCINRNDDGSTCTGANILPAVTPLPASKLNPAAAAYINAIYNTLPVPNAPNFTLITAFRNVADFRQEVIKIDHTFTNRLSAYFRYEHDKIPTIDANSLFSSGSGLPGVATTQSDSPGSTHIFQMTYAASSKTIVEGRYVHSYGAILSHNIGLLATTNTLNPVTLPFTNLRDRITSVSGNGFSGLTGFGPYNNFSNKNAFSSSLSHIFGAHTMKFGGSYSWYRKNENGDLVSDASGANNGIFTTFATTHPAGVATSTTNDNLQRWANFLVGNVATFVQGQFDYTGDLRQSNIEAYAQDDWRFRSNLTLYFGVRWSRFGQPWDKNGRLSNFVPSLYNAANAPQVTGAGNRVPLTGNFCNGMIVNSQNFQTAANCTPTVSPWGNKIVPTSNRDFAPRVGLAWDPFKKGQTSVRMGYGMYHEQVLNGFALQMIGLNPPYQNNFTITNTRLDNPGAGTTSPPSAAATTIRAIDTNWHTPYMQQWSLDLQHMWKGTLISVGYYGSKGTHLIGVVEEDETPPGKALNTFCAPGNNSYATVGVILVRCQPAGYAFRNSATTVLSGNPNVVGTTTFTDNAILDQIRPYKGYRSITMLEPRFNSNYNSLQAYIQRRFKNASQVNVAYTWSHYLTDDQTDRSTAPQNSYDIPAEYGRAQYDRRHIFTANYIYEIPFFSKRKDFVGNVLGGWEASGIVTFQSGLPFTATTSSFDAAGLGNNPAAIAGNRPNMLCDPNANAPHLQFQYFNTACFQFNPSSTPPASLSIANVVGNAPRGGINGPPTKRFDFSLFKNIRFGESMSLQLRGEMFNVFNHTNFRTFASTNVTSLSFGQIGSVRDPRTIQLGAKFLF